MFKQISFYKNFISIYLNQISIYNNKNPWIINNYHSYEAFSVIIKIECKEKHPYYL